MEYDLEYFIAKFEAIPEDKWCTGVLRSLNRSCALGHCGATTCSPTFKNHPLEVQELIRITGGSKDGVLPIIGEVNDGFIGELKRGDSSPKQRVVHYLKSLRTV